MFLRLRVFDVTGCKERKALGGIWACVDVLTRAFGTVQDDTCQIWEADWGFAGVFFVFLTKHMTHVYLRGPLSPLPV